jgi:hypothetical protein
MVGWENRQREAHSASAAQKEIIIQKGDIKDILTAKAAASGFDTSKLIFVDHD